MLILYKIIVLVATKCDKTLLFHCYNYHHIDICISHSFTNIQLLSSLKLYMHGSVPPPLFSLYFYSQRNISTVFSFNLSIFLVRNYVLDDSFYQFARLSSYKWQAVIKTRILRYIYCGRDTNYLRLKNNRS